MVSDPIIRDVLDFSQPVALTLVAVLHFIPDEDKPAGIIETLVEALPPGSWPPPTARGRHDRGRGRRPSGHRTRGRA